MSKKSDDSIERIFRQALTQYDSSFRESDWLKMEKMLNEEAERNAAIRSKRIKGIAFTLTGLTGLIIAVYFLAFNNPSDSIARLNDSEMQAADEFRENGIVRPENPSADLLSENSTNESPDEKQINHGPPSAESPSEFSDSSIAKNQAENTQEQNTLQINPDIAHPGSDQRKTKENALPQDGPSNSSGARSGAKINDQGISTLKENLTPGNTAAESESTGLAERQNSEGESPVKSGREMQKDFQPTEQLTPSSMGADNVQTQDQGPGMVISDSTQRSEFSDTNAATRNPEFPRSSALEGKNMQQDSLPVEDLIDKAKDDSLQNAKNANNERKKIKPASHWSVGLVLAPEFSTTSLSRYSAPGESFGLRIGYQVSNRFNVSTGIIRSTKKYEDNGDVYSPRNPAYWQIRTNGVVPEEIDSKCLVYELPLNIQFDAMQSQKSRMYVGIGISSYFMTTQAYDYTFETPNPGADTGWRSQESESYWFSVGMVSAGYERFVNRSLSIGVEPYLKVSLAEIGWPNIKLFSAGAYVTLRYRFMNKKNIE